jgi:dihydroorotate dehydrogenase (fumarate)
MDLSTRYLGLTLKNPLVVGSSGLTRTKAGVLQCEKAGAGAVVLKSIFEEQIIHEVAEFVEESGHQVHPEAADYIRRYGHDNAVAEFLDLIRDAKREASIPIIASVHSVSAGAWTRFAEQLEKAGADAIELNVNVLTSDTRLTGPQMEQVYFDVAEQVRKVVKIPVALKVGYHFSGMAGLLARLGHTGIAGLTLFNRPWNPDIDLDTLEVVAADLYSTPDEFVLPLRWVSILSGLAGCDLAAATGIHDGKTAIKMLLAGATAVQVVSTLYRNGFDQLGAMLGEIEGWMGAHGYERLSDFRGKMSQAEIANPAAFERVQFMKVSVGVE